MTTAERDETERACENCAYQRDLSCWFPEPQDGSERPFMAAASMPDPRSGGANCHHFRAIAAWNKRAAS